MPCRRFILGVLLGGVLLVSTTATASQEPVLTPRAYLSAFMKIDRCAVDYPLIPFQPSQDRLAFLVQETSGTGLYLLNPGSTTPEPLAQTEPVIDFDWSPDGQQIAFASYTATSTAIKVIRLADKQLTTLLNWQQTSERTHYPGFIAWSPDGTRIAFGLTVMVSSEVGVSRTNIMVMQSDGSQLRQLTFSDSNTYPSWSPDSTHIAYLVDNKTIYTMEADGSNQTQLTNREATSGPIWLPDGMRIAFTSICDYMPRELLFTIRPDGTGLTPVLPVRGRLTSWSPDGTRVAVDFQAFHQYDIHIVYLDGSGISNPFTGGAYASGAKWAPR